MGVDILSALLGKIASDPKVQAVVMGLVVKMAVDRLKKLFVTLDDQGVKQYSVPVQALVAVCAMLATIGDLYLTSQLQTFDPQKLVDLITITLPVYLNAMGIHLFTKNVKEQIELKKAERSVDVGK